MLHVFELIVNNPLNNITNENIKLQTKLFLHCIYIINETEIISI